MKTTLQRKLLLSFSVVLVVTLVGFAIGVSGLIRQYFYTAKQQELIAKGREMAIVLDDHLSGRLSSVQFAELIDRLDGFLDARVWAVDSSRQFLAMSVPRKGSVRGPGMGMGPGKGQGMRRNEGQSPGNMRSSPEARSMLKELEPVFKGETLTRTFLHPYYEEEMMIVAVPLLKSDGTVNGVIVLNAPVQGLNDFLHRLYVAVSLTGLLALVLTLFVATRLSRSISRPLRDMQETAASMARGAYDRRVEITSQDEVGQLGQSLNVLANELGVFVAQTHQAEQLRREFVANVSHELRTPLTVIRGYTEALRDGTVTDPVQAQKYQQLIVTETERLERLIRDLLDLGRLQSGHYKLALEPVPLPDIVDSVLLMLRPQAEEKGVSLQAEFEEAMPTIVGNGDRLTQLLLIFLHNALKYTPFGGKIGLRAWRQEETVVLEIADTGAGIPAEDIPRIWDRFYKVDKAHTREDEGTGLGLAIAREIIERHGASVDLTSVPGQGTKVTLRFPAAK